MPPAVDTNFLKDGQEKAIEPYSGRVARVLERMRYMDAATVASIAYRDLMKSRRVVIPSAFYRALRVIMKFVPQGLVSDLRTRYHTRKSSNGQ